MNAKHTQGPWTCKPGTRHDAEYFVFDSEGNFLTYEDGEHEANARLISAAPDLLAALEACEVELSIMKDMYPHSCTKRENAMLSARSAIAKALGSKP